MDYRHAPRTAVVMSQRVLCVRWLLLLCLSKEAMHDSTPDLHVTVHCAGAELRPHRSGA